MARVLNWPENLLPVREGMDGFRELAGHPTAIEVAAWSPKQGQRKRLRLAGKNIWCHWLTKADYELVRDQTNYTLDPAQIRADKQAT